MTFKKEQPWMYIDGCKASLVTADRSKIERKKERKKERKPMAKN